MLNSGIYQITCLANNKRYIGSSSDISFRLRRHFSNLKCGKHRNSYLQRAYDKYGKDGFIAKPIIYCDPEYRHLFEQMAIEALQPEFNLIRIVDGVLSHSETTKRKMSGSGRGRTMSPETKAKISAAHTGIHRSTEKATAAAALANKGKTAWNNGIRLTEEQRAKISKSQIGRTPWNKGVKLSDEAREKISTGLLGNKHTLGYVHTEETCRKKSESMKLRWKIKKGLIDDTG